MTASVSPDLMTHVWRHLNNRDSRPRPERAPDRGILNITVGPTETDVMLYDEISYWGVTAQDVVDQLAQIATPTINLRINSPGGDVFDGIAIMNALADHPAQVNVTVDGLAASAASFIAMAGDTVTMNRGAQMMIHDASGLCIGNASDMTEMAVLLDRISDTIAAIYASRAGGRADSWRKKMRAETWYSATEAVTAKLADEAVGAPKPKETTNAVTFDLSCFHYAGRNRAPAPVIETPTVANEVDDPAAEPVEPAEPAAPPAPEEPTTDGLGDEADTVNPEGAQGVSEAPAASPDVEGDTTVEDPEPQPPADGDTPEAPTPEPAITDGWDSLTAGLLTTPPSAADEFSRLKEALL